MKKILFVTAIGLLTSLGCYAQEDAHLRRLTESLLQLRQAKASKDAFNKTILDWSSSGCPKVTLMDEIKRDEKNESRGNGVNKFKMNQVVTHVYHRQNAGLVSKGDFFNSTEKDVYYSAIEKTIKKGCTATYTLTGHIGEQEFVFMSYNPKTKFSAKVNGKQTEAIPGITGMLWIKLPRVRRNDIITFSITNKSESNESFVILNYNPQR